MWEYNATADRVVDGDTIDFLVDLGFKIYHKVRVRLADVDTPEKYGIKQDDPEYARGVAASEFTAVWLNGHGPHFVIVTKKTGKYGRWIAVIRDGDGNSLNDAIVEAGHVK